MKLRYSLIVFLLAASSSSATAQWALVGSGLLGPYSTLYGGAMASHDGIVYAAYQKLFKSLDSGKTWMTTSLVTGGNNILDVCFFDKLTGIVAVEGPGVFMTHDGGNSWSQILDQRECMGVAFVRNANEIIVADRSQTPSIHYSSDGGQTWRITQIETKGGGVYQVLTSRDGNVYALSRSVAPSRESHISESTDFGLTWFRHSGGVDLDCYSFTLDSCSPSRMFVMNEAYNEDKDGFSKVFRTSDHGDNYEVVKRSPAEFFSASGATTSLATYVGSSDPKGIFRTTDHGNTWLSIGGPFMHQDSRLLTAMSDNIIFAADEQGNIWQTINSGGTPLTRWIDIVTADERADTIGASLIRVPISVANLEAPRDVEMVVHYDNDLEYLGTYSPMDSKLDIPGEQWKGRSKLHIVNATNTDIIAYAEFNFSSDSERKQRVWFDSLDQPNAVMSCEILSQDIIATCTISPPSGCGITAISSFMRAGEIPEFSIYPNPASNSIFIKQTEDLSTIQVAIVDQLGRVVASRKSLSVSKQTGIAVLDVSWLANGVYHLRMDCNGFEATKSIIIHR